MLDKSEGISSLNPDVRGKELSFLPLRIVWAFTFFIEVEPSEEVNVKEVSPEEFEAVIRAVFEDDKDD